MSSKVSAIHSEVRCIKVKHAAVLRKSSCFSLSLCLWPSAVEWWTSDPETLGSIPWQGTLGSIPWQGTLGSIPWQGRVPWVRSPGRAGYPGFDPLAGQGGSVSVHPSKQSCSCTDMFEQFMSDPPLCVWHAPKIHTR